MPSLRIALARWFSTVFSERWSSSAICFVVFASATIFTTSSSRGVSSSSPEEPLSPREQEVLKLIAEAFTNKQIAETLHLAEKTVESHRANLLRKLGMRDRVELVRYAIRRGLTEA